MRADHSSGLAVLPRAAPLVHREDPSLQHDGQMPPWARLADGKTVEEVCCQTLAFRDSRVESQYDKLIRPRAAANLLPLKA